MNSKNVSVINANPEDWLDLISKGNVDAIVVNQLFLSKISEQLSDGIVVWDVQGTQDGFALLVGNSEWLKGNVSTATDFLKALYQSESYYFNHRIEANDLWRKRFNYSQNYFKTLLTKHQFGLSLDQSLVVAMEDETRWMIKNNLTTHNEVPLYNDYI